MRVSTSLAFRFSQASRMRACAPRALHQSRSRAMPQDMPPEGGYAPVQYKRNLPARGFRPFWYVVGSIGIMAFGFYHYGVGVHEYNELGREKMWARLHLIPLLTAEEDRDQVRRHFAEKEREKELLGSENSVYHSDRFIQPAYTVTPPPNKE